MRAVLDTNVVVSGILWSGAPRSLLGLVRDGSLQLFTSEVLLAELEVTLSQRKFAKRLEAGSLTVKRVLDEYRALCVIVVPLMIPRTSRDPDDDVVLGTALAAVAETVVSGDAHLLEVQAFREVQIIPVNAALNALLRTT